MFGSGYYGNEYYAGVKQGDAFVNNPVDSVPVVSTLNKLSARKLFETMLADSSIVRSFGKRVIDIIVSTFLTRLHNLARQLSGIVSASDRKAATTARQLDDSATAISTYSKIKGYLRTLLSTISVSDSITRAITMVLTSLIVLVSRYKRVWNGIVIIWDKVSDRVSVWAKIAATSSTWGKVANKASTWIKNNLISSSWTKTPNSTSTWSKESTPDGFI